MEEDLKMVDDEGEGEGKKEGAAVEKKRNPEETTLLPASAFSQPIHKIMIIFPKTFYQT